ncbi:hypothetical protein D0Y65_043606 [Glycine soja]|uniref:Uncharacterized protein n=1 Tax=Glycine soja TaxID=3848 RepID=A0A445GI70_GLYSO|nr:hypothetical protein D0Y65_043606 [Glycine soja]
MLEILEVSWYLHIPFDPSFFIGLLMNYGPIRIMYKHLKSFAPKHIDTKFIKLDAEDDMNHSIEMILEFA